jgi:hypothetical protein
MLQSSGHPKHAARGKDGSAGSCPLLHRQNLSTLGGVALAQDESIDLRYAAFTSLEPAGPTSEAVTVMRVIARDATLGNSDRSVMSG